LTAPVPSAGANFAKLLADGVDSVNNKVLDANAMVHAFVLDDKVPVHQVTFALEQARLSLELMTQVRSRLVEGYQQLMNMQL
jgi:flagellar hook-basal body complex protein FliE